MSPGFTLATRFTAGNRFNTKLALKLEEALHCPAAASASDTESVWEWGAASNINGGTSGRAADLRGRFMKPDAAKGTES